MNEQRWLTHSEIRDAINGLSQIQKAKLFKQAGIYALGTDLSREDVVQTTLCKALEGDRRCPSDVSVLTFLINCTRSICNHARANSGRIALLSIDDVSDDVHDILDEQGSADTVVRVREIIAMIETEFSDDPIARHVLQKRYEGWKKDEACDQLGISSQQYDAAVQRLRRATERYFRRGAR